MKTPKGTEAGYIRTLSSEGGRLLFCFNATHEFYRLAVLDGNTLTIETNNFSGGVFYPVTDGDSIYYTGKFSRGDKLMIYPDKITDIKGTNLAVNLEKTVIPGQVSPVVNEDFKAGSYNPLNYFSPFQCWLILPSSLSRPGGFNYTIDSVSAYSLISDPVDENTMILGLGYNYIENFANLLGQWNYNGGYPVSFSINGYDNMAFNWQSYSYYRQSSLSANFKYALNLLPVNNYIILGAGAQYYAAAQDPGTPESPYYWPYNFASAIFSGSAGFSTLLYTDLIYDERGMSFISYIDYSLVYELYKSECSLTLALPLRSVVYLYGAYSPSPVFTPSGWDPYFGGNHYPDYNEFASENLISDYYMSGEYSQLVFSDELQNGWFPVYFNRLFMTVGYRGIFLEEIYSDSLFARLDLQVSAPAGFLAASLGDLFWRHRIISLRQGIIFQGDLILISILPNNLL